MPNAAQHIAQRLTQHVASHKTGGQDWPANAEYAIKYNTATWPCGWCKESDMAFFTNRAEMDAWLQAKREWSKYEDNHFAYQAYVWNWGPNVMLHECLNTGNLPSTYAEKQLDGF